MASTKQQVWLEEYLQCWNATEAARRAGYKQPKMSGHANKQKFADEIAARLQEKHMAADEVLSRLSDMARGTIDDFVSFSFAPYPTFTLDLDKARRRGVLHLIKKLKYNSDGLPEIELHDAKSALELIGKKHGLFKNVLEIDWRKEAEEKDYDAGELYEQLVRAIATALSDGDRADDSGGVAGS